MKKRKERIILFVYKSFFKEHDCRRRGDQQKYFIVKSYKGTETVKVLSCEAQLIYLNFTILYRTSHNSLLSK